LFGEVVLRVGVGCRVNMVLLGGAGVYELVVDWERFAEFATEVVGVTEECCG